MPSYHIIEKNAAGREIAIHGAGRIGSGPNIPFPDRPTAETAMLALARSAAADGRGRHTFEVHVEAPPATDDRRHRDRWL